MANIDLDLELSDVLELLGNHCTSERHAHEPWKTCEDCVNGYVPNEKFRKFIRLAMAAE